MWFFLLLFFKKQSNSPKSCSPNCIWTFLQWRSLICSEISKIPLAFFSSFSLPSKKALYNFHLNPLCLKLSCFLSFSGQYQELTTILLIVMCYILTSYCFSFRHFYQKASPLPCSLLWVLLSTPPGSFCSLLPSLISSTSSLMKSHQKNHLIFSPEHIFSLFMDFH